MGLFYQFQPYLVITLFWNHCLSLYVLWSKREEIASPTTQKSRQQQQQQKYRKSYPLKGLHKHKRMITCSNVQDITSSGLKLNQVLRARPSFRLQPSRSFFSASFLEDQLLLSFDDLFIPRSSTFNGLEGKTIRDRRGKTPKFRKQDTLRLLYIKLAF